MIKVEQFMELDIEKRQEHLQLESPCEERGIRSSKDLRGLLAFYLNTTVPENHKIYVCHACHNGKCCNPLHIYWGTPMDNYNDQVKNGTSSSIPERTKAFYGEVEYMRMIKEAAAKGGRNGKSNLLSPDVINQRIKDFNEIEKRRGYIGQLANKWNIGHASVRRFLVKHKLVE